MFKRVFVLLVAAGTVIFMNAGSAHCAHPLVTDDTGTQGKGNLQFEFIGEYGKDDTEEVVDRAYEFPTLPFISYGISENADLMFGMSFHFATITDVSAGTTETIHGLTDASIELKARFYEKDGLSLAIKPGVSLPTGNDEKGLGNGRATYAMTLITSMKKQPWAFHLNLGYKRDEYRLPADKTGNRSDIWSASIATETAVLNDLRVVGNAGIERNRDKTSEDHPAFILGGIIYSIREDLDIDVGVKRGISKPEIDFAILAGVVWRY